MKVLYIVSQWPLNSYQMLWHQYSNIDVQRFGKREKWNLFIADGIYNGVQIHTYISYNFLCSYV